MGSRADGSPQDVQYIPCICCLCSCYVVVVVVVLLWRVMYKFVLWLSRHIFDCPLIVFFKSIAFECSRTRGTTTPSTAIPIPVPSHPHPRPQPSPSPSTAIPTTTLSVISYHWIPVLPAADTHCAHLSSDTHTHTHTHTHTTTTTNYITARDLHRSHTDTNCEHT